MYFIPFLAGPIKQGQQPPETLKMISSSIYVSEKPLPVLKVSLCAHVSENVFLGSKTVFLGQRESTVHTLENLKSKMIFT